LCLGTPTNTLRYGRGTGSREKAAEAGVVLHQPLNLRIFLDFAKNGQNLNGIPVCRSRKTQNAPTWQVEKQARRRPISAYFCNTATL